MTQSAPVRVSARIPSLDGLRGVAAAVVVLYHCSMIARPFVDGSTGWAWVTQSPAKVLLAGTEAVLVFFVLSGLVVALPALRSRFDWPAFMAARLVRLYLPVFASLLFAAALILLLPRDASMVAADSWSATAQARTVTLADLLHEASLTPASYDINNVLWSLRWELLFSLALPIFVGLALVLQRWAVLTVLAAIGLSVLGRLLESDALVYLPVFLIGTVMAVRLDDVLGWVARPRHPGFWPVLTVLSLLFLVLSWLARPLVPANTLGSAVLWGLAAAGAAGVVLVALGWSRARDALETAPVQWLGRTSFSLYLVHVPVLGTLTYFLGDENWLLVATIGVPLSLVLGWAFTIVVEQPSHRLAKALGRRVSTATKRFRAPTHRN